MTIDEQIAIHVMKWKSHGDSWATGPSPAHRVHKKRTFRPSTNLLSAWKVIQKLESVDDCCISINKQTNCWEVIFWDDYDDSSKAEAETLEMAICGSALKLAKAIGI